MHTILDKPDRIGAFYIASQISAIKIEGKGLKFRGGSILAHCKRVYGLKGNREKVIAEMEKMREKLLENKSYSPFEDRPEYHESFA